MIQHSFHRASRRANTARAGVPQVLAGRKLAGAMRRGFTLIEVMVALAILSLLLVILFVPLNLGVNMTQLGTANADSQQAAQTTMNRIVGELSRATFVFPNQRMVGITDKAPYTNNTKSGETIGYPYYQANGTNTDACSGLTPVENTSRLSFLLPRIDENPGANRRDKSYSIVTYYARREDPTATADKYDAEVNPLGLYRTRLPYKRNDGTLFPNNTTPQALVDNRRYPSSTDCGGNAAFYNSGARWLVQNELGEPLLGSFNPDTSDQIGGATPATDTVPFSDSRITPKGAGLYAPAANVLPPATPRFEPETTFICEDTNNNGVIDRVTITLVIGKYDSAGAQNRAQTVRLTRVVDLPNTETRFGS